MHEQGIYAHFDKEKLARLETKQNSLQIKEKKPKKIMKLTKKSKKKLIMLKKNKKVSKKIKNSHD